MSGGSSSDALLDRAARGERAALDLLLSRHRERLLRIVELRLDRRVRQRVGASDVIQEAFLEAYRRIGELETEPTAPFFVWLRFLVVQKLGQIHRREMGVKGRDARRDVSLDHAGLPAESSAMLAAQLVGKLTGPDGAALRAERQTRLVEALQRLREADREVLALRHFEQLSNGEIAHVLDISESSATHRYVRALRRLKAELQAMPGGLAGLEP